MVDKIGAFDPNIRQQLAAMLSGDAKAGSVRAQLVHGLIGSSTGDDAGLVAMTPLGAAFQADAANRDVKARAGQSPSRFPLGKVLGAAAGMIPGEGAAADAVDPVAIKAIQHLADNFHPQDLAGDIVDKAYESGGLGDLAQKVGWEDAHRAVRDPGALPNALIQKFSPIELATMHHDMQAHLGPDAVAFPPEAENAEIDKDMAATQANPSIRAQLEAASKDPDEPQSAEEMADAIRMRHGEEAADRYSMQNVSGKVTDAKAPSNRGTVDNGKGFQVSPDDKSQVVSAKTPPTVAGTSDAISRATTPQPVTPHDISNDPESMDIIHEAARGDPKKINFIKNAMQDEGGNVPEEVADNLVRHLQQGLDKGDPQAFNLHDLLVEGGHADPKGEVGDITADHLSTRLSIPEMLAMHYDLDPETMGKAYDMPPAGSRSRPTQ